MIRAEDIFWDVKAQEREEERAIAAEIDGLQRVIALGRRTAALKQSVGFQDFQKAINDLLDYSTKKLIRNTMSNEEMREQRGKVEALQDILAILDRADETVGLLAAREAELQNQLAAVRKARPVSRSEQR